MSHGSILVHFLHRSFELDALFHWLVVNELLTVHIISWLHSLVMHYILFNSLLELTLLFSLKLVIDSPCIVRSLLFASLQSFHELSQWNHSLNFTIDHAQRVIVLQISYVHDDRTVDVALIEV